MTNWAQIFTGLVFYAYVGIHQARILVYDNKQTCPVPLIAKSSREQKYFAKVIPRFRKRQLLNEKQKNQVGFFEMSGWTLFLFLFCSKIFVISAVD